MQLRSSGNGHVLTVTSLEGQRVTLSLEAGRWARLSLYQPGSQNATSSNVSIEQDTFVDMVQSQRISC